MAQQSNDNKGIGTLKNKIFFTLICLAVYRIGVHIPTPGVDGAAVSEFFNSQSRGIFGLFNTFSGGALAQFSVFALGIMPYISASIIFSPRSIPAKANSPDFDVFSLLRSGTKPVK